MIILGFSIGSKNFINKSLAKISSGIKTILTSLQKSLDNIKTVGQLFNNSLLPSFYRILCAAVFTEGINSINRLNFKSEHTNSVQSIIHDAYKHLVTTDHIPSRHRPIIQTNLPKRRTYLKPSEISYLNFIRHTYSQTWYSF